MLSMASGPRQAMRLRRSTVAQARECLQRGLNFLEPREELGFGARRQNSGDVFEKGIPPWYLQSGETLLTSSLPCQPRESLSCPAQFHPVCLARIWGTTSARAFASTSASLAEAKTETTSSSSPGLSAEASLDSSGSHDDGTASSKVPSSSDSSSNSSSRRGNGDVVRPRVRLHEVVIVGAARTAVGAFQGSLSHIPAPMLAGAAIAGALSKAGLAATSVQEVLLGNVLGAGLGQAPAKQAALAAGVPDSAVCTAVNKVCSSGLKAVLLGAQSIMLGTHQVVAAGGTESMSRAPFLLHRYADLHRAKDLSLPDSLTHDGLLDFQTGKPMGALVEECVDEMRISRDEQDEEAIASYSRALAAEATGKFLHEIVPPLPPVHLPGFPSNPRKGSLHSLEPLMHDEQLKKFDPDKLRQLPPFFLGEGTITAGNASKLGDGAAALILTSAEYAEQHGLRVLARVVGWSDAEQSPSRFPTSPSLAIPRGLEAAGLQLQDAELFEIGEAFAAVTLANCSLLGLQREQVNVHGGAVALGHPLGASGARILVSLLTGLGCSGTDVGVAAICNGGGGASAIVVQREPSFVISDHHDLGKKKA